MNLSKLKLQIPSFDEISKKHLSTVLLVFIGVVALLVGFVVYREVRKFTQANSDTSGITGQIVKTNLNAHEGLTKRLEDYSRFSPRSISGNTVFSTAPRQN